MKCSINDYTEVIVPTLIRVFVDSLVPDFNTVFRNL